jgi:hypothetical protein
VASGGLRNTPKHARKSDDVGRPLSVDKKAKGFLFSRPGRPPTRRRAPHDGWAQPNEGNYANGPREAAQTSKCAAPTPQNASKRSLRSGSEACCLRGVGAPEAEGTARTLDSLAPARVRTRSRRQPRRKRAARRRPTSGLGSRQPRLAGAQSVPGDAVWGSYLVRGYPAPTSSTYSRRSRTHLVAALREGFAVRSVGTAGGAPPCCRATAHCRCAPTAAPRASGGSPASPRGDFCTAVRCRSSSSVWSIWRSPPRIPGAPPARSSGAVARRGGVGQHDAKVKVGKS